MTDTGSYSDLVFGLFAICGYQFSPRIADISGARLWRFDLGKDYGPLQPVSRQRIQVERIRWRPLKWCSRSWPMCAPGSPPRCRWWTARAP
ncbi:Tn3 family transposase [Streptomyces antibioticus]|uniref:Tn3 family transposase n=1 Tax=Streptomyces antibioticus TaxID=1890 RepID=UPI003F4CDA98